MLYYKDIEDRNRIVLKNQRSELWVPHYLLLRREQGLL